MMENSTSLTKKRLGIWLPYREDMVSVTYASPGALLKEVRLELIYHLSQNSNLEIIEIDDFRNEIISCGEIGSKFNALDAFVWFGEIGRDFRRDHNLELLKLISRKSVVINSAFGYEIAMDKYLTSTFLSEHDLPVPKFMLINQNNVERAINEISTWKSSILLKPRLGSYGIGIIKVDRPSDLVDILDYIPPDNHYLERLVPNDPATWIGINIINGEHAYSYRKGPESFHDGWKVMDRKRIGGKMILAHPTEKQLIIAKKIAKLLDMAWVGIDIITDNSGNPYVVDVNAFPGLYPEMFKAANINGPELMAKAVFSKLGV